VSLRDGGSTAKGRRPGSCPLAEFLSFPANTQLYARLWLRDGAIHPAAHWIIRDRLAGWVQRVSAAPVEIRAALTREAAVPAVAAAPLRPHSQCPQGPRRAPLVS
jgi:hypothetical protein